MHLCGCVEALSMATQIEMMVISLFWLYHYHTEMKHLRAAETNSIKAQKMYDEYRLSG